MAFSWRVAIFHEANLTSPVEFARHRVENKRSLERSTHFAGNPLQPTSTSSKIYATSLEVERLIFCPSDGPVT